MSERSQNLKDVRQYEERTCVRQAADGGRLTKPIFTGPSYLSPGSRQAGTLGTNQSQPRPLARHEPDGATHLLQADEATHFLALGRTRPHLAYWPSALGATPTARPESGWPLLPYKMPILREQGSKGQTSGETTLTARRMLREQTSPGRTSKVHSWREPRITHEHASQMDSIQNRAA